MNESAHTTNRDDASGATQSATAAVRDAEYGVNRAAWDVHCHLSVIERLEGDLAKQREKLATAREKLATARDVRAAVSARFPEVDPEEVDEYGLD